MPHTSPIRANCTATTAKMPSGANFRIQPVTFIVSSYPASRKSIIVPCPFGEMRVTKKPMTRDRKMTGMVWLRPRAAMKLDGMKPVTMSLTPVWVTGSGTSWSAAPATAPRPGWIRNTSSTPVTTAMAIVSRYQPTVLPPILFNVPSPPPLMRATLVEIEKKTMGTISSPRAFMKRVPIQSM